jgi:eukaryotic translation initiation factor 2C
MIRRELVSIRAAAREIGGDGYNPKITFVVCAKRHHMRFYATSEANKDQKTGNLPPGLVVDSGVTDPFIFEFYRK